MTITVSDETGKIDIPSRDPSPQAVTAEEADPTRARAHARGSAYPLRWGRGALRLITITVGDYRDVWEATPTPVGEVWGWARAGGWTGHDTAGLRWVYAAYAAGVAVPVSAVTYWAVGALMQVSGLDEPDDPQGLGWTPATPPPAGELWWRRNADVEAAETRPRVVALTEGSVVVLCAAMLACAWVLQRPGRVATVLAIAGTVALCRWR